MDIRIKILKKREEIIEARGHATYEDYYKTWATPIDLYGNEIYEALNAKLENVIIFEVRYCRKIEALQAHCKEYRVEYKGELYDIYATSFKKNEKTRVLLKTNRID